MIEIVRKREEIVEVEYYHEYDEIPVVGRPGGGGYAIPCNRSGELKPRTPAELQRLVDLKLRLENDPGYEYRGVVKREWRRVSPAIGRCHCGGEVVLDHHWTNYCDSCDREYNLSGQLLAPRYLWGEETGEWFGSGPPDW